MNNIFSSNTDITILLALVESNKYNKITFLKNCLDSLKEQSFTNFEFIIFDNQINLELQELISNYNFCKYTYLNYINPVNALNYGLKNCFSKYLTFINYNYTFSTEYLNYLKLSLDINNNSEFIYSSHELITKRKITIHATKKLPIDLIFNFPGILSFLFKKSIIDKIGFLDENIFGAENYDYFCRIILYNSHFLSLDYTLTHYNQNVLDNDTFDYFELEKKIAQKLSTNIIIEQWYPTVNLCSDINRAKSIALFDFCFKIINCSKKAFNLILYPEITNYFLNSYLLYSYNVPSLLNYFYFCKKKNILPLNNLKNSDILYNFDIKNPIEIDYSNEEFIKNNNLYLDKQIININNYLKLIYNTCIKINNMQLVLSSKFNYLKNYLIETYNFTDYISNELPTVFFGCYDDILEILKNHNGKKYIYWIDYDLYNFTKKFIVNNTCGIYKNCIHIANNKYIYDILINFNFKVFLKETNIYFNNNFTYNKNNSNKILVYTGDYNNNFNPIIYGKTIVDLLIEKFQNNNISFILTKDFQINYNDQTNLNDIKIFVKLTEHENYSNIETYFNLLKIPIINTFNDFDDLVSKISSLL